MRIGFDARCLNTTHIRGMGKVLLQLLSEGLKHSDSTFVLFGDEPRAPMHAPTDDRIVIDVREFRGHRFRAWEQIALPWLARRLACDVLHCPGTWCPYWQPIPTVVTLHDTLPWTDDQPRDAFVRYVAPAAYRRASAIVAPSDSSRSDITSMWPDLVHTTSTIPWGVANAYLSVEPHAPGGVHVAHGARSPYLLYFGGEIPRKRLDWALQIWQRVVADWPELRLVLCGLQAPEKFKHDDRVTSLSFVPEADMPALYASAEAVLYPTLYEGFGFPALESQATGTPVLMSAVGSLRELAGPGAILLPVNDLDGWIAAVKSAPQHRRATAEAAREWARRFTWTAVWSEFQKVYERAATMSVSRTS